MDLVETNKECYISVKKEPLYNYTYNLGLVCSKYTLVIEIKSYKTNLYTWYTILPQILLGWYFYLTLALLIHVSSQ